MAEEKYDVTKDPGQSSVRYVTCEPDIDFTCERIIAGVEYLCDGRLVVPELPAQTTANGAEEEEEEAADRLDPLFEADDYPQPFLDVIYENESDIFGSKGDVVLVDFLFKSVFSILFHNRDTLQSNIDKLSKTLCSQDDRFHRCNVQLLCLLFNVVPVDNELRALVMRRMLDLATKMKPADCQDLFRGQLSKLQDWIDNDWKPYLTVQDKKHLYQCASNVANKAAEQKVYLTYLVAYLKLFNSDDAASFGNAPVVDEAAQAMIAALSCSEFNTQFVMELIRCNIVDNVIQKTPKYAQLYQLLKIVYQAGVAEFETFFKQNETSMRELGFVHEDLLRKMRLLTLCSLGHMSAEGSNTYPFEDVMDKLQVDTQNELEAIIISAMKEKLLFAKIDYTANVVDITKAKQRTFNDNSWSDLSKKLALWRHNTNTVLQIIHNAGLNRWRQQYMQEMARQAQKQ